MKSLRFFLGLRKGLLRPSVESDNLDVKVALWTVAPRVLRMIGGTPWSRCVYVSYRAEWATGITVCEITAVSAGSPAW